MKTKEWRMFEVRKFRSLNHRYPLLLLLIAFSVALAAQESASEKEKEKKEAGKKTVAASELVHIKGSVRCDKPDPAYSLDVPDRAGHSLIINHRKCTWTEPLVILGAKTKTGVEDGFTEKMEGTLHVHSYEVDTLDDGEKISMKIEAHILAEKGPVTTRGRFNFMSGSGKFKGIAGGGTCEGNLDAEDVLTLELEGVYEPAQMAGGKKEIKK